MIILLVVPLLIVNTNNPFVVKNSSEQERGIFPSLPDTSTFGVNSPQMAQIRAKKTQNDPKSKERYPHHNRRQRKELNTFNTNPTRLWANITSTNTIIKNSGKQLSQFFAKKISFFNIKS